MYIFFNTVVTAFPSFLSDTTDRDDLLYHTHHSICVHLPRHEVVATPKGAPLERFRQFLFILLKINLHSYSIPTIFIMLLFSVGVITNRD